MVEAEFLGTKEKWAEFFPRFAECSSALAGAASCGLVDIGRRAREKKGGSLAMSWIALTFYVKKGRFLLLLHLSLQYFCSRLHMSQRSTSLRPLITPP